MHKFSPQSRGANHGEGNNGTGEASTGEGAAPADSTLRAGTHNVSRTCRFFGVSRGQFYTWLRRYRQHGLEGLKNLKSGSRKPHLATPPHIVALILRVRAERQYGPIRLCFYLQRFHQVYVSIPTIYKILKRPGVPRVSMKRYRPGPPSARIHRARSVRPGSM